MIIMGYLIIISQLGDSNEQHKHKFYENRLIMCFGYHKYTHLFWSTDKLGIYHVYATVVPRPLSNDTRLFQCIYRYSHASKHFVEV